MWDTANVVCRGKFTVLIMNIRKCYLLAEETAPW